MMNTVQSFASNLRALSPHKKASRPVEAPQAETFQRRSDEEGGRGWLLAAGALALGTLALAGCGQQVQVQEQPCQQGQTCLEGDFGEYHGDLKVDGNRVQGDFGEYHGDYTVQGERVQGDFGEYHGDFTVTSDGRVQGDFGEYHGDYTVRDGRVQGDFGEYHGDYAISTQGNVTRIKGDFGEYHGDFTVARNQDGSVRVQGDFGEYHGDYTVAPFGEGYLVRGDFGEYHGEYTVKGTTDEALVHPLGVGSLIRPDSPHAPMRWPSQIKTDD